MKKIFNLEIITSAVCFLLFILLIVLLKTVDVQIAPISRTEIGLGTLNKMVNEAVGYSDFWYNLTEVLGYISILVAVLFAFLGVYQLIKGKSFKKVDKNLYALLGIYILVGITYVLFEKVIINYRPILNQELEASFPSSHTLLTLCILGTGIIECDYLFSNKKINITIKIIAFTMMLLMVVGRMLSGVHWFTDILGSVFISASYIALYSGIIKKLN